MKSISNWSIIGFIVGLGIIISGWYRYFIQYYDPSSALIFIYAGVSIIAFSWLYSQSRKLFNNQEELKAKQFEFEGWVRDNLELKGGKR